MSGPSHVAPTTVGAGIFHLNGGVQEGTVAGVHQFHSSYGHGCKCCRRSAPGLQEAWTQEGVSPSPLC